MAIGLSPRLGPKRTPGNRRRFLGRSRLYLAKALIDSHLSKDIVGDATSTDVHVDTAIGNERPRRRSRKYPQLSIAGAPSMTAANYIEKRFFSAAARRKDAATGAAMPDGSFPIKSPRDVRNAMALLHHHDTSAVRAHIRTRAKAVGAGDPFAKDFNSDQPRDDRGRWAAVGENLGRLGGYGTGAVNAPRIFRAVASRLASPATYTFKRFSLHRNAFGRPSRIGLGALAAYGAVRVGGAVGSYVGSKVDDAIGHVAKAAVEE